MCFFCKELQQEKLNIKQISKLGTELMLSGDETHIDEYIQIVRNLSQDYNERLQKEENDYEEPSDFDPFDSLP